MYKKAICILLTLHSLNAATAQDSIKLLLDYKMVHVVDTTQRGNPRITPCMLLVGSATAVFDDYYRAMRYLGYTGLPATRVYEDPSEVADATVGISCDMIYSSTEKGELITGTYINNVMIAKSEPLPTIEWTIHDEKKQILQQECQMATAYFRGRHYTAWFAPGIPVSGGPWKLSGLPGMILAANDDKNEISFTCTKISTPEKNAPAIVFSPKARMVSTEEFDKTIKIFNKDPKAAMAPSDDPRGTFVALTLSQTGVANMQAEPARRKPRPTNNPIEKQ